MDTVTVSSKGQIAIPKFVRDALNLTEGTKLALDIQGHKIVLSKEPAWKKLRGAGAKHGLMAAFEGFKRQEREREDPRS